MHLAVIFENIGGYHAARLRSAQHACAARGGKLTAIEITAAQTEHQWGALEPAETPFPIVNVCLNKGATDRGAAITRVLDQLRPEALAIPGWGFDYSRAALRWCGRNRAAAILMSESKRDDEPRTWWKEWLKARLYVRRFAAALVGAHAHRDYLVQLGMKRDRIFLGYDVVDNDYFSAAASRAQREPEAARLRQPAIPERPYFLAVTRLIPRKNVLRLIESYEAYRAETKTAPWDLVICGSGMEEKVVREVIASKGLGAFIHRPGFVSYRAIGDWYGLAGAFIHAALQEQWGLVVNEAMAAGLPVLVSNRCGCFPELVTPVGAGFDPSNREEITHALLSVTDPKFDRAAAGEACFEQVQNFSPSNFGRGLLSALEAATKFPLR